jgi:NAD(P)H-hydrate epimerase
VLVVGGSREYTGSPIFNCLGAYAAGADLVTLLAPKRAANAAASYAPEIIAPPLACDYLNPSAVQTVLAYAKNSDALVIGGGLSRRTETRQAVLGSLTQTSLPTVVDADALRFIAGLGKDVRRRKNLVLTPHAGELAQLAGIRRVAKDDLKKRVEAAKTVARAYGNVVLFKGHSDVITDGKRVMIDLQGSSYLTKGGHGDVLAGVVGALLARKIPPFNAAATGAYLFGKAGALAAEAFGESTKPTDVLAKIPLALRE